MTQPVSTAHLIKTLRDARARTLQLLEGLDGGQLIGPKLAIVNPMLWEIGHVAWFYEYFILRRVYGHPALLTNGDNLYDSIAIAHDRRWNLPLLSLDETLAYMEQVHGALIARLTEPMADEQDSFIYQFATFHEYMHDEAYLWARQTLAYPRPTLESMVSGPEPEAVASDLAGDSEVPGGTFVLGSSPQAPFLFDNEKWAHPVEVAPFRIARATVTNSQFASFVEDEGYRREAFWDDEGRRWREEAAAQHPVYWRKDADGWYVRRFDEWLPLSPFEPVVHVNWHEANAYCRWAGRRLPTEVEWEVAATAEPVANGSELSPRKRHFPWGDEPITPQRANLDCRTLGCIGVAALPAGDSAFGCRQMMGNVWEWTSDTFGPYPGFAPDAYREYSEMLFGSTKVLRGGAWTSHLVSAMYRNYFGPERRDVFAGFRTCAL